MSSQEESPVLETAVASTPVAVEAKPADTAPATETKSDSVPSKEVLKPDLPRLPKPDRRDLDARVLALQEVADVQQARIEELKRAIETRKDARTKVGAGSSGAKTRIQELNTQFIQRMVRPRPGGGHRWINTTRPDRFRPDPNPAASKPRRRFFMGYSSLLAFFLKTAVFFFKGKVNWFSRRLLSLQTPPNSYPPPPPRTPPVSQEERNVIRKDLLGLNAVQEKLREQANAMKQKLKFLTVEAVDREGTCWAFPKSRLPVCPYKALTLCLPIVSGAVGGRHRAHHDALERGKKNGHSDQGPR